MPIVRKLTEGEMNVIPGPGQVEKSTRVSLCGRTFRRAIGRIGHERWCKTCQRLLFADTSLSASVNGTHAQPEPQVSEVETITPIERRAQLDRKMIALNEARMQVHEIEADTVRIVEQLYADLDTAMQDAEKYRQIQAILRG
jgi:hypothetical protein